ncbi:reverse transcriptase [Caerostris darwini]|uniref:Reverse transcriptase n=1 Tax=Caerostris darwini TaxID=1538125 RepID=A0AAV4N8X3_9ARAC|nr:reverse transcriptase [Caerostris darwini]
MSKKKTSLAEEKYSSYELEVLAVVEALKNSVFIYWVINLKLSPIAQHSRKPWEKKDLVTRVARWVLLLEEFDYEITHRPGDRMKHVDALSRYPVMMIVDDTIKARLKKAQLEDKNICSLKQLLNSNESQEYFTRNEILYKFVGGRELIIAPSDMQTELVKLAHEKGHFSAAKTEKVTLSAPLPSTNKRYQHIFTVIDAFTKFTWLYPVKTVSTRDALDKLKLQQKTFGNPLRIISDRGSALTSKAFNDYCTEEGIQHLQIATGVPRGNGQIERIHRTLIPVLTKLSLEDATKWYRYVDKLQRILNSTTNRSTKFTPFELLTGVKMKNKADMKIISLSEEEINEEFQFQRSRISLGDQSPNICGDIQIQCVNTLGFSTMEMKLYTIVEKIPKEWIQNHMNIKSTQS